MPCMAARDLYEQDSFQWTTVNADLLRAGRFAEADICHIAEEIEDMGKSQRRALASRLEVLLAHLLKWRFQPAGRSSSWRATIRIQRSKLNKLLREMPSLRAAIPEEVPEAYQNAVILAALETGLAESSFPAACPYSQDELLDPDRFPE